LPPELYTIWEAYPWRFGEPYCLFKTFLTEATSTASVLTISAFTVERYMAIHRPLHIRTASGLRRASRAIVIIWLLASVTSIPYPLSTRTFHYVTDPRSRRPLADSYVCNIPTDWMPRMKVVFLVYSIALFVVPMIIIVCLYTSIGLTLRRRSHREASACSFRAECGRPAYRASAPAAIDVEAARRWWQSQTKDRKMKLQQHELVSVFYSCRQAVLKMLGRLTT
jgi:neuromedin U receptor 1